MEHIEYSLTTLNGAIAQKLRSLESVSSAKDIKEINNFLRESQRLKKTLYSIGDLAEEYIEEEGESYIDGEGNLDYLGILIQACDYIIGLHSVADFKKVKSAKSQWLLDESADFLTELRQTFGARIPALPGSLEGRDVPIESCEECSTKKGKK